MLWLQRLTNWNAGSCWSSMLTIAQRVQNGIKLLDTAMPGWREKIDISRLDLMSPNFCVLGQVMGRERCGYTLAVDKLSLSIQDREDAGFLRPILNEETVEQRMAGWEELTTAWKEALLAEKANGNT